METSVMSALDRPVAELTVMDVYDIAAVLGQEFERVIDRFGCESLVGVVPKVVRVLELLEALVSSGPTGQEAEELRRELDRLRQERSDRYEQERKHQKELELVEDVWRGEVQDLLSQITQLQAENKGLLVSLSLKESPVTEEDLQKQEGMSEKERQMMNKLKNLVDKQRDEIRAKDHELTLKNEDVEALQMQQHRLIRINQDLRHRIGVMEAQGKALIQQRAELEAAAQARQQELGALQLEVVRLRKELRGWELEREVTDIEETSLTRSGMSPPTSPQMTGHQREKIMRKRVMKTRTQQHFYWRQLRQSQRRRQTAWSRSQTNLASPCRSCGTSCRRRMNSRPKCSCYMKSWHITEVRSLGMTSAPLFVLRLLHHAPVPLIWPNQELDA
ncbi:RILP-like protein 1 isoform X3 [Sander lucioperca]|uniref:RILP-like protein 1 isoform X3 n=1 Tax=Sander lucioperca TaxID=283035 RepID=UPI0016538D1E|nr:RILP-like protein 1 isoform X3 [Sander lucioperca]